ncbi:MAG: ABC transporter ATP-binding protein [Geminicoccaceae bacterium]|nr:ABC transporter ATP-binding protein [Geminicoccaceae bacterium]
MARIELRDLAHSFAVSPREPQDCALKTTNIVWEDGGAYALLGPPDCGNTTLLDLVSGLTSPSRGSVLFDDRDVTPLDATRRNIAQVFRVPVVYDTMTVAQNLGLPLRNRRIPTAAIQEKVAEIAEMLDLDECLHEKASSLSPDRKQKISMGRGLIRDDVAAILFDEPLAMIAPRMKGHVLRKLRQIHARFHHTMVYATRDQDEALTFADKVAVMQDGEVVQFGTPQELFEVPAHRFVGYFIGSPGMNFLPCRPDDEGLSVDDMRIALGGRWMAAARGHAGKRLELGVRPEFLRLETDTSSRGVPIQVLRIDDMGAYRIVTVGMGRHQLKVKVPEGIPFPPDLGHLVFDEERTFLYADQRLVA